MPPASNGIIDILILHYYWGRFKDLPIKQRRRKKMHKQIGVEAKSFLTELPDFQQFLLSVAPPVRLHENIYIYDNRRDAEDALELLKEADLLEEKHHLVKLTAGGAGEDFFDYGFYAEDSVYLYIEDLAAFKITDGNNIQIDMALVQLEEHLVFETADGIFFTTNHYIELIKGIVRAYEVKVEFLDLDK
jgi:hypothetical protein